MNKKFCLGKPEVFSYEIKNLAIELSTYNVKLDIRNRGDQRYLEKRKPILLMD